MPTFARFFNRHNDAVFDIELHVPFLQFIANVRTDGALLTESVFLPVDQIAMVLTVDAAQATTGTVVHLVPNPDKPA